MTEIGGYFGFETWHNKEHYHSGALAVNSGRHALELVLKDRAVQLLYMPKYYCRVLMEPMKRLGVEVVFYDVTEELNVPTEVIDKGWLLYINYFGLKGKEVSRLAGLTDKLIIDNSQAFYSQPLAGVPTFYSCRKFFGVPDGGYVYGLLAKPTLETDDSTGRFEHMLGRATNGAQPYYAAYKACEAAFSDMEPRGMSVLTQMLLTSVDYTNAAAKRIENFKTLHDALGDRNEYKIDEVNSAAMCYPFIGTKSINSILLQHKIYIGSYWPNVLQEFDAATNAYKIAENVVCLPIDHRYSTSDMERVAEIVKKVVVS